MATRVHHVGVGVYCGGLLALMLCQSAMALTIGDLQVDNGVVSLGEQAAAYYAQSFVAPGGVLDEVTVKLASAGGPGDTHFRILITETTSGAGAGIVPTTVLFESPTLTLPFDPSFPLNRLEFTAFTVPLGALLLNAGSTYALILDAFVGYDGVGNAAGSGLNNNAYPEGHFFHYGGPLDGGRADHFANSAGWIDRLSNDLAFEIAYTPSPVAVDIKPGSFPNSINPRSRGKIPVAILTTGTFDATTVDSTTVFFGATGTEAAPVQSALEDVNGDGNTDMILHFNTQDTAIVCGATFASLTGETISGQAIQGSDSINTVGCK